MVSAEKRLGVSRLASDFSRFLDARLAGEVMERSIAGQVEFWARIGLSLENVLDGRQVFELCRKGTARPVLECLVSADTAAGRRRVAAYLRNGPFPRYEPHPDLPGLLVRIAADGERTTGRFIRRQFRAVKANLKK